MVDALQDAIGEYAVIPPAIRARLEQDVAAGPDQPAARLLVGREAGDRGRSIAPAGRAGWRWHGCGCALPLLAVLLVAAVVAVAVVIGLSR